jgi:hypothetical protein
MLLKIITHFDIPNLYAAIVAKRKQITGKRIHFTDQAPIKTWNIKKLFDIFGPISEKLPFTEDFHSPAYRHIRPGCISEMPVVVVRRSFAKICETGGSFNSI